MTAESIKFLEDNRFYYDQIRLTQSVSNLDGAVKAGFVDVIRKEFDHGYQVTLWCGSCIMDMITFAYVQYEKQKK